MSFRHLAIAGILAASAFLGTHTAAVAQVNCPDATTDDGQVFTVPIVSGLNNGTCVNTTTPTGVAPAAYDNAPVGSNSAFLEIFRPDSNPRPASTNSIKLVFSLATGNPVASKTLTCGGAASVTGAGTTLGEITLNDGASCSVVAAAPAGTNGQCVQFNGTLTRNGNLYSVTNGVFTGDVYGGVPSEADPVTCPAPAAATDTSTITSTTTRQITNFMSRRADQITTNDPDLVQRLDDRSSSEGAVAIGGVGFSASGTFENAQLGFSTSLRQMVAAASADRDKERMALGRSLGISDASVLAPGLDPNGLDVWVQGTWAHVNGETSDTDLGLFYAGIDYRISPSFLLGVLGQFDWTDEQDGTNNFSIEGRGWMVGPYVVARLNDNAIFEGRLGWGESENDISPFNTYTDTFDTERWFAKAKVTGQFDMGGWIFSPHVAFLYFGEEQKAYTDSNNIFIPSQSIDLGRLTFGPEVSSSYTTFGGTSVSGHIGIKGIWDFAAPKTRNLTTGVAAEANEGVRARIEGGATMGLANGWNLSGESFYDGIGADDFDAYGGSVRLTVPLN